MSRWISQFFCNLNSSKNFTCPSGKLITEFTSPIAKSTSPGLSDTTFFTRWTLNSNRTNHKPLKKKPIKNAYICPCDSAEFEHDIVYKFADALYRRFRASVTQAIPANPSILGDRLLFYIENTIDTDGSSLYPGCKAIAIKNLLRPPITFRVSNQMNPS